MQLTTIKAATRAMENHATQDRFAHQSVKIHRTPSTMTATLLAFVSKPCRQPRPGMIRSADLRMR